jgi:hypothetical protein
MESQSEVTLQSVFKSFSGGKAEMSNKEFLKINKDCGLIDKKYTSTDIDINFAKVKNKASKNITFQEFESALQLAAQKKGIDYTAIVEKVLSSSGPVFIGTKAEYNKFHDDKSLYTGVYAKGGPTNVDAGNGQISDISQLCDRTSADVRGTKKK